MACSLKMICNIYPSKIQSIYSPMITLIMSLILHALIAASGQTSPPYNPADNIALDCGSPKDSNLTQSNRVWVSDVNSKFFPLHDGQNAASWPETSAEDNSIDVPYLTARVSASEFRYTVPVTPGPKFIRLHFYAAMVNVSMAFSVRVDRYTFLTNFSGSPTAMDMVAVKEYIVVVHSSSVAVAFTPEPGKMAFVNGIEIVSMPRDLYYTDDAAAPGLKWIGQESSYVLRDDTALETVYRLDIGGDIDIPPNHDTGMFRSWGQDSPYLTIQGYSKKPALLGVSLNFSLFPNYTAPESVYLNARSLGGDNVSSARSYNLTWEFPVDPHFNYMLRLHFCEIVKEIKAIGDKVFQIFIANQTAEEEADIIRWSRGKYVPYFRDYVTTVLGKGKQNLTLALHASKSPVDSLYYDAILNGLEIFKLSSRGNLSGIDPDIVTAALAPKDRQNQKSRGKTATIGIVAGIASAVILLALVGAFFLRRGRKNSKTSAEGGSDGTAWWGPISFGTTVKSSKTRGSTNLPSDLCRCFSLSEIKAATNNFEDAFIIGVGGFGNVYKGHIDEGTIPVAIKRLKSESSQGIREFKTEIEMLSHLRHRHLVSLIGYCDDRGEMILVYEYMSRGTLRDHLYKSDNPPLTWRRRLEACVGAARGLHYLHAGAKHNVIHRDVKTTNILLDDAWVAKVSDFGLSKAGPTTTSKGHVSTVVKGSFGYLDPEYYRLQQLTEKSDVYSFGVVLCEVLCGRPPILRTAERRPDVNLANWTRSCHRNGTLGEIVDPNLAGKISPECLKKYGEIAVSCMSDNGSDRPSMNDVVWSLEFAMQLQQKADEGGEDWADDGYFGAGEHHRLVNGNDTDETTAFWENTTEIRSSGVTKISSSENESATGVSMKVFSEIYDPKAR